MMQPTATQRLYSDINSVAAGTNNNNTNNSVTAISRYSPTVGYRSRITTNNSIFSSFDDPFFQQARAAQAALAAEFDVKNVHMSSAASMLRSTNMFSNYQAMAASTAANEIDFDFSANSLVPSNNTATTTAMLMDPAESMASLMAMQHHYNQQHHQQQNQQLHFPTNQYQMEMAGSNFASVQATSAAAAVSSASSISNCFASPFSLPLASTSSSSSAATAAAAVAAAASSASGCSLVVPINLHQNNSSLAPSSSSQLISRYPVMGTQITDLNLDTDPRELERFAEHFKQRRIKLGVTQADVGKALAHLKMPGVGSLSQSTICRFESLTLSHNNMVALKPILHSWLGKAEDVMRKKECINDTSNNSNICLETHGILPNSEKKRKRTSIAAPEKRLLEDFFRQQPRPTGDRISAIAEKLDLKKNVVRVWFCNQRQKQKRSQFRTQNQGSSSNRSNVSSSSSNSSRQNNHSNNITAAAAAAALAAAISNHNNLGCTNNMLITNNENSSQNLLNLKEESSKNIIDAKFRTVSSLPPFAELSVEAIVGAGGILINTDNKSNVNAISSNINNNNLFESKATQ